MNHSRSERKVQRLTRSGGPTAFVVHIRSDFKIFIMHPASLSIETLLKSCQVRRQRRSGPGGQHRNKVETGIFIEHTPSGIRAEATEGRSQAKNQERAVFRLRIQLALEHRRKFEELDPSVTPSELWKSRIKGGQIKVNSEHTDFPTLLAEALDVLAFYGWEPREAKESLGCSATQLVKLLKKEPRAFACLNRNRTLLGLSALR